MRFKTLFALFALFAAIHLKPATGAAQDSLFVDHFTGGTPSLDWISAFHDSAGNELTPMQTDNVPGNPSGDGWIGIVEADTASLGGLGLAMVEDTSLTDYSMEAQIYVQIDDASYYEGIMVRINRDTSSFPEVVRGYQLVSNFYPPFGMRRLKFRKYSSIPDEIEDLRVYNSDEIPGGAPTQSGWHTFKIDVQGDLFWLYWDGQELPDNPQIDTTSTPPFSSGGFGIYAFNFGWTQTGCDDIVVMGEAPTGVGDRPADGSIPRSFSLSQNYPNPFNPMTTIRVDIPAGEPQPATLAIYDLRGRMVRRLVDRPLESGTHLFAWSGQDDSGQSVPSGTYIYRLRQGANQSTKKMILMK